MSWHHLIEAPWIVLVVYWVVSAAKTQRTVSRESFGSRYGVLALEIIGFVLLFSDTLEIGILGRRMLPRSYALGVVAVALTWLGVGIALWARWHLGQFWSARVTLKEDHQLIRAGPYAHFRHPIYSGLDLAAVGTAVAIDEWKCVAGLVFIIAGYWIKARKEESMLSAQFGAAFEEHCRHTGFLIPKF